MTMVADTPSMQKAPGTTQPNEDKTMVEDINGIINKTKTTTIKIKVHELVFDDAAIRHALNHTYDLKIPSDANLYCPTTGVIISRTDPIEVDWQTEEKNDAQS